MNALRVLALGAFATLAAGCGNNSSNYSNTMSPTPAAGGSSVSIVACATNKGSGAYSPNPITISRGGSVTWMNNDSITHTSTSDNGTWSSGNIAPGGSYTATFSSSGSFTYHCQIHPGMVGTVTVQ